MPGDFAHVNQIHMEPPSEQVSQIDVEVKYGRKGTRLRIPLEPPLAIRQLTTEAVAQELRDLGTALLRIADQPSSIIGHNLVRSSK